MKIHAEIEQGSAAWYAIRLGIPTASNFKKIVTPVKCELSKSAGEYALRLCAERLLNMPTESIDGVMYMERGKELEPFAVKQYEFTLEAKTVAVGFITNDEGTLGCSPDRLVVGDRKIALEIKCPSPHVHLGYLLSADMDTDYKPQVQGQILVAELDRADFYSFHPRMPPKLISTTPDKDYIAKMRNALSLFNENLAEMMQRAVKLGAYQALLQATTPLEAKEAVELSDRLHDEAHDRFQRGGFNA